MILDPKMVQASEKLKRTLQRISLSKERFTEATKEFQGRYFNWCLNECKEETRRNFELVRMVQDSSTCIFLDFVETLTPQTRKNVLPSLCKATNDSASLTDKEIEIYQRYRQHWSEPVVINGRRVSGMRATLRQLAKQERFLIQSPSTRTISHALRKSLKYAAGSELGWPLVDNPSLLAYESRIGLWYVVTGFEFGRYSQLRYSHSIHAQPGGKAETRICSGISILSWTGIHPDSTWSWLLPEDVPDAINAVKRICTHFLQQSEPLVVNLPR